MSEQPRDGDGQPSNMKMIRSPAQSKRQRVMSGVWRGYQYVVNHRWMHYMVFVIWFGGGLLIATMMQQYLITTVELPATYVNSIGGVIVVLNTLLISVALLIRMDLAWSNEGDNQ